MLFRKNYSLGLPYRCWGSSALGLFQEAAVVKAECALSFFLTDTDGIGDVKNEVSIPNLCVDRLESNAS